MVETKLCAYFGPELTPYWLKTKRPFPSGHADPSGEYAWAETQDDATPLTSEQGEAWKQTIERFCSPKGVELIKGV